MAWKECWAVATCWGAGCGSPGFAMVMPMSDEFNNDPSANTTQFQAFVAGQEPEQKKAPIGLIIGGVVLAVVVIGVVIWAVVGK